VIRFNYHQSPYERFFADATTRMLTARLRVPMAALGAVLLAVTGMWSIETHRVVALEDELRNLRMHVEAANGDRVRAEQLMARVARLRALNSGIAVARREAIAATNTIAKIGNGLPAQTWLTGVGAAPGGAWTIDGRSTSVSEIGIMLRRVQSIDEGAATRLVSIAATGHAGRVLDFVIGWERRQ
jgi:hypothetical protein